MSLTDEELELLETMSEPPDGYNHGRERGEHGGWEVLETPGVDPGSFKHFVEEPRTHGTRYTYQRLRCRCAKCRLWNSTDLKRRRAKRDATPRVEEEQPQ